MKTDDIKEFNLLSVRCKKFFVYLSGTKLILLE